MQGYNLHPKQTHKFKTILTLKTIDKNFIKKNKNLIENIIYEDKNFNKKI